MASYKLLTNATATISAASIGKPATLPPNPVVTAHGPTNPNMPAQEQAFQLSVVGIGAVSATVQVVVSDDGQTWSAYNDPFTANGTDYATFVTTGSAAHRQFGAYLTAISGTNATANLSMSA